MWLRCSLLQKSICMYILVRRLCCGCGCVFVFFTFVFITLVLVGAWVMEVVVAVRCDAMLLLFLLMCSSNTDMRLWILQSSLLTLSKHFRCLCLCVRLLCSISTLELVDAHFFLLIGVKLEFLALLFLLEEQNASSTPSEVPSLLIALLLFFLSLELIIIAYFHKQLQLIQKEMQKKHIRELSGALEFGESTKPGIHFFSVHRKPV